MDEQEKKELQREHLDRMVRLYKYNYIRYHEPRYMSHKESKERKNYLNHFRKQLLTFLLMVQDDPYMHEITQIQNEGFYTREPMKKTLQKIEKRRVHFRNQQWAGLEYNQPFIPVEDLVEDEGERPVIRFLIQCFAAEFFLKLFTELEKAIDRAGIGKQEELALIRRARDGQPLREEAQTVYPSFRWQGKNSKQKIEGLFNRLQKRGFIEKEATSEQFVNLFSGNPVEKPVRWIGQSSQLLFLVELLVYAKELELPPHSFQLLKKEDEKKKDVTREELEITDEQAYGGWLYDHIEGCFLDESGNRFTRKRLKHLKSALHNKSKTGKPMRGTELEKIIEEVIKEDKKY